jgi:polyisoprenoid-binding protein YceI
MRRSLLAGTSLLAVLAAGCTPAVTTPVVATAERPVEFPSTLYIEAHERGEPVFRVDSDSVAVVRVYRGGTLARLGHDHVVAARKIDGYVLASGAFARADLQVALNSLTVDEPALRAQAGFETQPSQKDIDGTRRNMTEKVLDVERFPFIRVHVERLEGDASRVAAKVDVALHGVTRTLSVPVEIERPSAETLYVDGRFSINQTDFGIAPYSILGGALQVLDRLDIEFRLHATRVPRGQSLAPIG